MKRLVENWAPPLLLRRWRDWRRPVRQEGAFATWEAASAASSGYATRANVERVREAALQVRDGRASFERDGIVFRAPETVWPVVACLQTVAAANGGKLDAVDFGGSLGSTYFQHQSFFGDLPLLRWNVVEQAAWVEAGRADFATEHLNFFETVAEAEAQRRAPQVLLLSGVLPYLQEPARFLAEMAARDFTAVLIDRTGVLRNEVRDRLTVQRVRPPLFHASYPCWLFARETLLAPFASSFELVAEFPALDESNLAADYRGFFFRRKSRG